ncbi:uncharacterized protein LOC117182062 isoform X2 [Belonocnema kinseyi]|uniref:uncharacterized protein LOC117182062 isoform X2 n=1 Tax=Belonocnema kinseyi TaxID=2817044 RepID=UPI00143DD778|nr:uncharacterized protein LOC117182062 isoform X2 [Belonocnema kinseyi]
MTSNKDRNKLDPLVPSRITAPSALRHDPTSIENKDLESNPPTPNIQESFQKTLSNGASDEFKQNLVLGRMTTDKDRNRVDTLATSRLVRPLALRYIPSSRNNEALNLSRPRPNIQEPSQQTRLNDASDNFKLNLLLGRMTTNKDRNRLDPLAHSRMNTPLAARHNQPAEANAKLPRVRTVTLEPSKKMSLPASSLKKLVIKRKPLKNYGERHPASQLSDVSIAVRDFRQHSNDGESLAAESFRNMYSDSGDSNIPIKKPSRRSTRKPT